MEKKEYAVSYYGGHVSAWLCVVVAIAGIMFMLLGLGGGTKSMMVALFFALVLGLLLAKDRKAYGEEMLAGLRESMFCVICVAFFMAGLLSALLKSCGLIEAMIWLVAELHINTGFIPVVAFLVCVIISTACGTSTGTVTAVSAVICPLAGELDINMGLMCGAVISGSIFGDNLAPISDTAIPALVVPFALSAASILELFVGNGRWMEQAASYLPFFRVSADTLQDCYLVALGGLQLNSIQFSAVLYPLMAGLFGLLYRICHRRYQVTGR